MNEPPWRLLYRIERVEGKSEKVWLYAQMFGKELIRMQKAGWEWIK